MWYFDEIMSDTSYTCEIYESQSFYKSGVVLLRGWLSESQIPVNYTHGWMSGTGSFIDDFFKNLGQSVDQGRMDIARAGQLVGNTPIPDWLHNAYTFFTKGQKEDTWTKICEEVKELRNHTQYRYKGASEYYKNYQGTNMDIGGGNFTFNTVMLYDRFNNESDYLTLKTILSDGTLTGTTEDPKTKALKSFLYKQIPPNNYNISITSSARENVIDGYFIIKLPDGKILKYLVPTNITITKSKISVFKKPPNKPHTNNKNVNLPLDKQYKINPTKTLMFDATAERYQYKESYYGDTLPQYIQLTIGFTNSLMYLNSDLVSFLGLS